MINPSVLGPSDHFVQGKAPIIIDPKPVSYQSTLQQKLLHDLQSGGLIITWESKCLHHLGPMANRSSILALLVLGSPASEWTGSSQLLSPCLRRSTSGWPFATEDEDKPISSTDELHRSTLGQPTLLSSRYPMRMMA